MRLALTFLGLDLFTLEVTTDSDNGSDPGDCTSTAVAVGFTVPEREWDEPEDDA